jgi:hypothetical protein
MAKRSSATALPSHLDKRVEQRLDQELEQTFPASDALQITRDPASGYKHGRQHSSGKQTKARNAA